MRDERHGRAAVVLVRGHLMGICTWVGGTRVATTMAAAEHPDNRPDNGSVQAVTSTFADEAVESRVGHTVQAGQQQWQVVVIEYG